MNFILVSFSFNFFAFFEKLKENYFEFEQYIVENPPNKLSIDVGRLKPFNMLANVFGSSFI